MPGLAVNSGPWGSDLLMTVGPDGTMDLDAGGATMSPPSEPKDRLAVLFGSLAEQVEEMTDEQILDEAVSAGVDVKAEADRIRGVLLGAVGGAPFTVDS